MNTRRYPIRQSTVERRLRSQFIKDAMITEEKLINVEQSRPKRRPRPIFAKRIINRRVTTDLAPEQKAASISKRRNTLKPLTSRKLTHVTNLDVINELLSQSPKQQIQSQQVWHP